MSNNPIGDLIREYRVKRKMNATQLGQLVGVSQATISNIERGKRKASQDVIDKIIKVLEIPTDNIEDMERIEDNHLISYRNTTEKEYRFAGSRVKVSVEVLPINDPSLMDVSEMQAMMDYTIHINASPMILDEIIHVLDGQMKDISTKVVTQTFRKMEEEQKKKPLE
ncbi:MAG: helix-turn-helix domain-containing protein [Bacillaceae bacterium]